MKTFICKKLETEKLESVSIVRTYYHLQAEVELFNKGYSTPLRFMEVISDYLYGRANETDFIEALTWIDEWLYKARKHRKLIVHAALLVQTLRAERNIENANTQTTTEPTPKPQHQLTSAQAQSIRIAQLRKLIDHLRFNLNVSTNLIYLNRLINAYGVLTVLIETLPGTQLMDITEGLPMSQ